ncbi:MAG TPA: hypothetical protein VE712_02600 [Actinomycetota bacterium]|jgi:hypothetical protein|nr:hypothetical protein [Actinomycetota bacterium]
MADERTLTEEDIRTVWAHKNGSAPVAQMDDDDDDTTDVGDDSDSTDASDTGDDA